MLTPVRGSDETILIGPMSWLDRQPVEVASAPGRPAGLGGRRRGDRARARRLRRGRLGGRCGWGRGGRWSRSRGAGGGHGSRGARLRRRDRDARLAVAGNEKQGQRNRTGVAHSHEEPLPPSPLPRARERGSSRVVSPPPCEGEGRGVGAIRLRPVADDRQLHVGARRRREPGRPRRLERGDLVRMVERQADVVEAVQQAVLAERLDLERVLQAVAVRDRLVLEVDASARSPGSPFAQSAIVLHCSSGRRISSRPFFAELLKKMSANDGAMIALKPYLLERPGRVLARRAAAEVVAGHQDRAVGVLRAVQHEVRVVLAPALEEELAPAGPLDPLQVDGRDDLVGVDVGAVERHDLAGVRRRTCSTASTPPSSSRGCRRSGRRSPPPPPSPG